MVPWAGLLAPGSFYSPRLPDFCRLDCFITQSPTKVGPELVEGRKESVAMVAVFVPGYSGGSATDLHRLPLAMVDPEYGNPSELSRKAWVHHGLREQCRVQREDRYLSIHVSRCLGKNFNKHHSGLDEVVTRNDGGIDHRFSPYLSFTPFPP